MRSWRCGSVSHTERRAYATAHEMIQDLRASTGRRKTTRVVFTSSRERNGSLWTWVLRGVGRSRGLRGGPDTHERGACRCWRFPWRWPVRAPPSARHAPPERLAPRRIQGAAIEQELRDTDARPTRPGVAGWPPMIGTWSTRSCTGTATSGRLSDSMAASRDRQTASSGRYTPTTAAGFRSSSPTASPDREYYRVRVTLPGGRIRHVGTRGKVQRRPGRGAVTGAAWTSPGQRGGHGTARLRRAVARHSEPLANVIYSGHAAATLVNDKYRPLQRHGLKSSGEPTRTCGRPSWRRPPGERHRVERPLPEFEGGRSRAWLPRCSSV